jgi:threonine dehydrogenase-like Zn-dependent dehydrogenase
MDEGILRRGEVGGRTVQINAAGEIEVVHYPVPPLAADQVRVRTRYSGISAGTEMTFYGRDATNVYLHRQWDDALRLFLDRKPVSPYPVTFGYRAVGHVSESGRKDLPVGTAIAGNWRHTEYVALESQRAAEAVVPPDVSEMAAIDLAQVGPICVNAVAEAEGAQRAGTVVVIGAGLIGLVTAQVARASGATDVRVVDRLPSRLAVAESLGFRVVDGADADVALRLKAELGSGGVSVVFECSGAVAALREAIRMVRPRGLVVAVGFYQGPASALVLADEFHHNAVHIRSAQIGNIHPEWSWERLRAETLRLVLAGQLRFDALPRLLLPVEQAAEGFAALRSPADVFQVVLDYGVTE